MTSNMTERNTATIIEKENYAKRFKRYFDSWRELVLIFNSVLLWKEKQAPWGILIGVTTVFLNIRYFNPNLITLLGVLGLYIIFIDLCGPPIMNIIWKQENWTAAKERELEEVCKTLANVLVSFKHYISMFWEFRSSKPNMFYAVSIISLILFAGIGDLIDNLFLTYLIVLVILMIPGSVHSGILQKGYQVVALHIANFLHGLSANQKKFQ